MRKQGIYHNRLCLLRRKTYVLTPMKVPLLYPFFISDWKNIQLDKFCETCGIMLSGIFSHKIEYFNLICQLENIRAAATSPREGMV